MADALLNQFVSQGTAAERAAFVPDPPTTIAGPDSGYFWFETDTGDFYGWDIGGAAWVKIAEATSVSAITALTGDVTATGPGSVAATIANNAVTLAKLATQADQTILANISGGVAVPTAATLTAILNDIIGTTQGAIIVRDATGWEILGPGSANQVLTAHGAAADLTWESPAAGGGTYAFGITIDGGGSDITTGVKGFVQLPTGGTIVRATILSTDASATAGSIVIDVWKDTYANYPPTDADSITAAAPPTLSAANKNTDATLTGWTTSVTALDIVGFNVDSCSGITRVTLIIEVTT